MPTYRYVNTNTVYNSGYNSGKTAGTPKATLGAIYYSGGWSTGQTCVLVSRSLDGKGHATYFSGTGNYNYTGDTLSSNSYFKIITLTADTFKFTCLKACTKITSSGSTSTVTAGTTIGYQYFATTDTYVWY